MHSKFRIILTLAKLHFSQALKMSTRFAAFVLLAASITACRDNTAAREASDAGGTMVIATTADPDALFPPAALNMAARQGTELIYEYLADVGPAMNTLGDSGFVKELASSWDWSPDSSSITFRLNPLARWHDGPAVTSRDVAFSFRLYTDTLVSSNSISELADIDSVTAGDSASATFWFKRRTSHQFYDAASLMLILPEHIYGAVKRDSLLEVASRTNPVGSGKYRLARWNRGSYFELSAVKNHYRGQAKLARLIWTVTPEYQSAVMSLLGGAADLFENVRLEALPQLKSSGSLNVVSLPGMDYVFMRFNLRDPSRNGAPHRLFASRDLRRAITMSIDRRSLVKNLFDTLARVGVGPTVSAFPTTDTAVAALPFDPEAAGRLLDSLGWKRPVKDGLRSKNGKPLEFTALVPVSSLSRIRISVMIQEQLRRQGVGMRIEQMDLNAFNERQQKRSFDAALGGWHVGSNPGGVRDGWTTAAAKKGGFNYGSYENGTFDALIDSALAARTVASAKPYFRRAHQIIAADAPAVWLYEPRTLIAIQRRIRTTPMRPSAWWLDVGSWSIPPAERIARDAALPSK